MTVEMKLLWAGAADCADMEEVMLHVDIQLVKIMCINMLQEYAGRSTRY